jgi:hypothetical protein
MTREHDDTIDAFPPLTDADLDRIGRQRQRPPRSFTWAVAIVCVALALAAGGLATWAAQRGQDSTPAAAVRPPSHHPAASPAANTTPAATPSTSPSPAGPDLNAVIYTCQGQPVTEPTAFTIACGDGNGGLSGLSWSSWTASGAQGSGLYYANTCTPDCAQGTFTHTPVTVTLSEPLAGPGGGEYFTLLSVPGAGSWSLGPDGPTA